MPVALSNDVRDQAKALYLAGIPLSDIGQKLDTRRDTIAKWVIRYEWHVQKAAVDTQVKKAISNTVVSALSKRGANQRQALAQELEAQAATLAASPPAIGDLHNTKARQGRAAMVKTLVEASSVVYGWQEQGAMGIIGADVGDMFGTIDVEATPACGIEAPTGGVQPPAQIADAPQGNSDQKNQGV